jgi:predicted RNA-binding Zn ribbon-like protein
LPDTHCLDFVSTVFWDGPDMVRDDQLRGYGQVLDWAADRGILGEAEVEQLREEAAADADFRRRALGRAWAFRRALHDCLQAVVRREPPPGASIALINAAIADSPPMFTLAPRADGIALSIPAGPSPDLLRPILRSALDLLSSPDLARLRECAAERCGRLYLDQTKNGSRRWCDMETCGNRAKARRHQAKRKLQPLP